MRCPKCGSHGVETIEWGGYVLAPLVNKLTAGGRTWQLLEVEKAFLLILVEAVGRTVKYTEFKVGLRSQSDAGIKVQISRLNSVLRKVTGKKRIVCIHGAGYFLESIS